MVVTGEALATASQRPVAGLSATAVALERELSAGGRDADLLRWIIQASDDFESLEDDAARLAFLAEPPRTGDARYDALLAGLAVHLVRRAGLPSAPAWTREPGRYLDRIWWFGLPEHSGLRAYTLQRTPSCMKARGVMFDSGNLASV